MNGEETTLLECFVENLERFCVKNFKEIPNNYHCMMCYELCKFRFYVTKRQSIKIAKALAELVTENAP